MTEKVLLVTGSLAEPRLERLSGELANDELHVVVSNVGAKVAALMTTEIVERRLAMPEGVDRVIMPGRFRGDIERLSDFFGTRFERGPDELANLPEFFGRSKQHADLAHHDVMIFTEIIDPTSMTPEESVERGRTPRAEGRGRGCHRPRLPSAQSFSHLERTIWALHGDGAEVRVDSFDASELSRATRAGADYLLSLSEKTIDIVDEGPAAPILVSAGAADMASLDRAIDSMIAKGRPYYADPILDPIHYGFAESIARYVDLRRRRPDVPIPMGIGNVTELTDTDTTGVNALLMGSSPSSRSPPSWRFRSAHTVEAPSGSSIAHGANIMRPAEQKHCLRASAAD